MIGFLSRQFQRLHRQPRIIVQTVIYGVGAAIGAVAFQVGINWLYQSTFVALATKSAAVFMAGSFLVVVLSSLVVGYLLNSFCSEAAGSGIPQLKLVFWKDFGMVSWRAVWVKFVAGILSIGGGSSLGREGPSVYVGAGLGSNLAGVLGEAKQARRHAAACGAAAGLAAAFNTPIAAVTFVLEEVIQDLNSRFLGGVLLAAVIGAFVVHGLIGKQPAFSMNQVEPSSWKIYLLAPIVSAVAAVVGIFFQKQTLALRARVKATLRLPGAFRPMMGGLVTWALGATVFLATGSLGVFSLGYDDLSSALTHPFDWKLAGILLIAKLAATIACYGFGGCGGIFSPTLFFGGMSGVFAAGLFGLAMHLNLSDQMLLAVVGMSSCLGAVVRAPVTGILIVFEMTHDFSIVPALMLGTLVSQTISHRMAKESFYEAILSQDGHQLDRVIPPRDLQSWQQMPVSSIANFQPVILNSLEPLDLQQALEKWAFANFPVVQHDKFQGMLTRNEALAALKEKRRPNLTPGIVCQPQKCLGEMQTQLLDAPTHVVIIMDQQNGRIIGLLTLHDLLRAQLALTKLHE